MLLWQLDVFCDNVVASTGNITRSKLGMIPPGPQTGVPLSEIHNPAAI